MRTRPTSIPAMRTTLSILDGGTMYRGGTTVSLQAWKPEWHGSQVSQRIAGSLWLYGGTT